MNLPHWDEYDRVSYIESFVKGGPFWKDDRFWGSAYEVDVFPSLLTLDSVMLSSWNITYLLYFGLIIVTISVYLLYLMLKDLNSRLTWVIIPISAFLFNPNQWENMLWALASEIFFSSSVCIVACIFFLRRIKYDRFSLFPSILFAVIASFSNVNGLIVFLVGTSTFYFHRYKKLFSIWIISATTMFLVYFGFYVSSHQASLTTSFLSHPDAGIYLFLYVSNGLMINSQSLQIFSGSVVILLIIGGSIFLKLQKTDFEKILPWIQLGLIGIVTGIITMIGRIGIAPPDTSRYITLANPAEISSLVIGAILFIRLLDSKKNKLLKIIFLIILIATSIMIAYELEITYSHGWYIGGAYGTGEVLSGLHCMLKPDTDLRCGPPVYPDPDRLHNIAETLLNLHLSPFSIPGYSIFSNDKFLKDSSWNMMEKIEGVGKIEYVNSINATQNEKITIKKDIGLTHATGWARFDNGISVDSAYLFIDDHVNSRALYGISQDWSAIFWHHPDKTNRWISSIDLSIITSGCHKISIRIIHENKYYESMTPLQFCID